MPCSMWVGRVTRVWDRGVSHLWGNVAMVVISFSPRTCKETYTHTNPENARKQIRNIANRCTEMHTNSTSEQFALNTAGDEDYPSCGGYFQSG